MKPFKVINLFVVLLLTMSLFSACSEGSRSNGDPPESSTFPTSESIEIEPELPVGRANRFRVGVSLQDESPFVLRVSETLQA